MIKEKWKRVLEITERGGLRRETSGVAGGVTGREERGFAENHDIKSGKAGRMD